MSYRRYPRRHRQYRRRSGRGYCPSALEGFVGLLVALVVLKAGVLTPHFASLPATPTAVIHQAPAAAIPSLRAIRP